MPFGSGDLENEYYIRFLCDCGSKIEVGVIIEHPSLSAPTFSEEDREGSTDITCSECRRKYRVEFKRTVKATFRLLPG